MKRYVWIMMSMATALLAGDIAGEYLVVAVESNGKKEASSMEVGFAKGGKLMIMGMPAGEWSYDETANKVKIQSVFDQNGPVVYTIIKQEGNALVLQSKKDTTYYRKIEKEKIAKENKSAPCLGKWKMVSEVTEAVTLSFTLPDVFSYEKIDTKENSTENVKGKWIYDKKLNSVTVLTIASPFAGENKVVDRGQNSIEFKNGSKSLKLIKQ